MVIANWALVTPVSWVVAHTPTQPWSLSKDTRLFLCRNRLFTFKFRTLRPNARAPTVPVVLLPEPAPVRSFAHALATEASARGVLQ